MTEPLRVPDVDTSAAGRLRQYPDAVGRALAVAFIPPAPGSEPAWAMLWQAFDTDRDDDAPVGAWAPVFAVALVTQPSGRDRSRLVEGSLRSELTWREAREVFAAHLLP